MRLEYRFGAVCLAGGGAGVVLLDPRPGGKSRRYPRLVLVQRVALSDYLRADSIVDHTHPEVVGRAALLRRGCADDVAYARAAFEFVRDDIRHSVDAQDPRVTLTASETLKEGVGLCFAKAHLLAGLLRAEGVPAGLCYQRLTDDGLRFDIHGLAAVFLKGAWHRRDPRGNKSGVDAQFSLHSEQLAWTVQPEIGECDYVEVFVAPHPAVVEALTSASDALTLCDGGLPQALSDAVHAP